MKLTINLEKLTLRDLADFEEKSGMPFGDVGTGKALPAQALWALVWVAQRREDPSFTYEAAGDLEITELDFGGTDPQPAAGEPTSVTSRSSRNSTGSRRLISGV